MVGGGLWRRAAEAVSAKAPLPPPPTTVSSSELGFLLDPTVEQLLLALYQQVTASAGHFFVEVSPHIGHTHTDRSPRLRQRGTEPAAPDFAARAAPRVLSRARTHVARVGSLGRASWCWRSPTCSSRSPTSLRTLLLTRSHHRYAASCPLVVCLPMSVCPCPCYGTDQTLIDGLVGAGNRRAL